MYKTVNITHLYGILLVLLILMHNYIQSTKNNVDFDHMFSPILMVLLPKFHQSIGATDMVAPIYW
jgi:hypothetical protein